ncbi:toprim domain-containing protein [Chitinibacter sp. FCG-7]|uniref:Toprim domain-containing protein n=1 Tax=Chitinibacter mangrovi TaxID=3153927 RepID=A0AAU7FD52_9NEIS
MNKKNAAPYRSSTQTQFDSKSFSDRVKAAVQGCWPETLQRMGIPAKLLDGRNHPCPACGGKDRFQFTAKGAGAEYGRFACRGLDRQGGDGFALVMHVFGLSFPDAVRAVANVLGVGIEGCRENPRYVLPEIKPAVSAVLSVDNTAKVQAVFDSCEPISQDNHAWKYLLSRGLNWAHLPTGADSPLRYHPALPYWEVIEGKHVKLGVFPALVAKITKPDGTMAGLHRIYLNDDGNKLELPHPETGEPLPCKKLQAAHDGALSGATCQLSPIDTDGRLAITEGIETGLGVHQMTLLPVLACISVSGLKSFVVPDGVREVIIYADNDLPDHKGRNAGKDAAYALARRLVAQFVNVKVMLPPVAGTDWLDVMNAGLNKEAA